MNESAVNQDAVPAAPGDIVPRAPVAEAQRAPLVLGLYQVLKREPVLFVTLGYLFVAFIGLWANYWFYGRFGIPVLEYMQGSDFLVAGVREPAYAGILVAAAVFAALITWPDVWRRRNAHRADELRGKWWGRFLFRNRRWSRWTRVGLGPEDAMVFGLFWITIWLLFAYVVAKAEDIRRGGGRVVQVTMAGERQPSAGTARLLGTSSTFVFLWWPQEQRAEAVPVESVGRIESMRHLPAKPRAKR